MNGFRIEIDESHIMDWAAGIDHPISFASAQQLLKERRIYLEDRAWSAIQDAVEDAVYNFNKETDDNED